MTLVRAEIRKLISKRNIVAAIFLLFTFMLGFLYVEQINSEQVWVSNRDVYESIEKEIEDLSMEEKKNDISEKMSFYHNVEAYEKSLIEDEIFSQEPSSMMDQAFQQKYQSFQQSSRYPKLNEYLKVYQYLDEYYKNITEYDAYLDQMISNVSFIKNNPLQGKASKARELQLNHQLDTYETLRGISLRDKNFTSGEQYANSNISVLIVFFWLFITLLILQSDEISDMELLISTTKKGRLQTRISKCMAIAFLGCLCTILLEGCFLLLIHFMYGGIPWTSQLQSIPKFYTSFFHGTFLSWYLLCLCMKIFVGFGISMVLTVLYHWFKKLSLVLLMGMWLLSYLCYFFVSDHSITRVLHYLNLYFISNVHLYFVNYVSFMIGPFDIRLPFLMLIVLSLIIILMITLYVTTNIHFKPKISIPLCLNRYRTTRLFHHEWMKVVRNNKLAFICLLLLMFQGYFLFSLMDSSSKSSMENKVIELYRAYGGTLNDEAKEKIENLNQSYREQEASFQQLSEKKEAQTIDEEIYQFELQKYQKNAMNRTAFQIFYSDYLQSTDELIYDKGYQAVFAMNTQERDIQMSILIIVTLTLLLHGIYAYDQQHHEMLLYETTVKGKIPRNKAKLKVVLTITLLVFLIYNVSDFLVFKHLYPMFQWNAKLIDIIPSNIKISSALPLDITLWQYSILLYLTRFFGILMCSFIIVVISKKSENLLVSCLASLLVFLLPMLFYYNGAKFLLNITCFDLIQGNLFLYQNFHIEKIIGLCLLLSITLYRIVYDKQRLL